MNSEANPPFGFRFTIHLGYTSCQRCSNDPADALSYLHANALHVAPNVIINFEQLAATQEDDTELVRLKSSPPSLIFRDMPLPMSESTIVCNVSTGVPQLYMPPT